jgi:membrane associated rhomboid family serine protease
MAFLQSAPPREPFLHAPPVILWLIGLLVAIHAGLALAPAAFSDELFLRFAFVPARYAEGDSLFALTVPLLSHMLLHGSVFHLLVNCLWLLAFGPIIARRYGTAAFLLFFILCGIAGAATHLASNWGSPNPVIGASGGISGLMAAGIRMLPWPNTPPGQRLAPLFSRPVLLFSGIWFATNLLFGLTGIGAGGELQQIAWLAHLGGYICGLIGIGLLETHYLRRAHPVPEG